MTRIITDAQAKYAHEHSQLVSGPAMRSELSNEWDAYITNVRAEAWEMGFAKGINSDRVDAALHETREIDLNPYRIEHT